MRDAEFDHTHVTAAVRRYIRLEGRSLNVYESADRTEKSRGSSIADIDVRDGCTLERGTGVPGIKWVSGAKPMLVLCLLCRADLQGGGKESFCFDTDELCDRFAVALEVLGLVAAADVEPTPQ